MLRYIGVSWNPSELRQCATARKLANEISHGLPTLRQVFSSSGLIVFQQEGASNRPRVYPIGDTGSVVLGTLFTSELPAREIPGRVRIDEASGSALLRSRGRKLLTRYWGNYVAFLFLKETAESLLIRDPSGAVPCYVLAHQDVSIAFSHLEDCLHLGIRPLSLNRDYIAARLVMPFIQSEETGLREVAEVMPGQCVSLRAGIGQREYYWDPVKITETDVIEDVDVAVKMAREAVQGSVNAWASCHTHIMHKLSGGLDSSIVLACLRNAPSQPDITCLHHYGQTPWSDERRFARMMTSGESERIKLIEIERRAQDVQIDRVLNVSPSPCPKAGYVSHHVRRRADLAIAERESAALCSGVGGDGVFGRRKSFAAIDYVYRRGLSRGFLDVVHRTARSQGMAIWKAIPRSIYMGARARWTPHGVADEVERLTAMPLLEGNVLETFLRTGTQYLLPPWVTPEVRMPPGKVHHLKMTRMATAALDPALGPFEPESIVPLTSQPLVELFLRIPTYILTAGGKDRAIARRAFAADLPREIVARGSKANENDFLMEVYRLNQASYREVLLDGHLVNEGFLDRRKAEQILASAHDPTTKGLVPLLSWYFDVELWLRSWKTDMPTVSRAESIVMS